MKLKEVLTEELEEISLSASEIASFRKISNVFITSLKSKGLKAFIGGSFAKGTAIKKKERQDVDIFVVFDFSKDILKLGEVLGKIKLPGKLKVVHGSRDYFQVDCGDVLLEVIPVLKNTNPNLAENVTDVSLSHVKYILGEIKKSPSMADEIRLAKAFCKAQRCYGAESYIHGFSGYSLEILVIYFKGFVKFLKGIQKKSVIDPENYFKNSSEVMREINRSKLQGPIVLVDPTHKYRNVCAGLNSETFDEFVKSANSFLKKPSSKYFELKEIDVLELKRFSNKHDAVFLELEIKTNRREPNIAGSKMKKFFDFFVEELGRRKQKVLKKEFNYSGSGLKSKGYLVIEEHKKIEIRGPSVKLKDAVVSFRKAKGRNAFKKKGYWWFKDKTSVKETFERVNKFAKEMDVGVKIQTN